MPHSLYNKVIFEYILLIFKIELDIKILLILKTAWHGGIGLFEEKWIRVRMPLQPLSLYVGYFLTAAAKLWTTAT